MDYLKIVLDGYCNPTDKKFLKEYFIRESKKASELNYTPEEFLTGCKDAVQTYLINDLYRQKSDARKELLEARQWAKEHDQELFNRTYEQEDNLNIENYTVNLYYLTNGRYTGHMDYSEIMHISDTLDLLISIDDLIDAVKNIQPTGTGTGTGTMDLSKLDELFLPDEVTENKVKRLKSDIKTFLPAYNKKKLAALAAVIYHSGLLHHNIKASIKDYKAWQSVFCEILGKDVNTYKTNQIKDEITQMKNTYYYFVP